MDAMFRRHQQSERLRVAQQGKGKPIIATQFKDYQFVAVGDALHYSKAWRTFPDFLSAYLKSTLGEEWGNQELRKPIAQRHPVLQWYDAYCRYQARELAEHNGEIVSSAYTGAVCCWLGLAYSLYLIKHNIELHDRLVHRLKNVDEFQGAYYELVVANCFIRAGFSLELEDETDSAGKHCEFAAVSSSTGTKYWVEAKMRSVAGVLGKTSASGSTSKDPTSRLSKHLNAALKKPADGQRFVFIDVNAEPCDNPNEADWISGAIRRLESREATGNLAGDCYVFVTSMAHHYALEDTASGGGALGYGLGMSDFGKAGPVRLRDWYLSKQKHKDAFQIGEALRSYPDIPDTFDGKPLSHHEGRGYPFHVGETYLFDGAGRNGEDVIATVSSIGCSGGRTVLIAVSTCEGDGHILSREMNDIEFEDYRKYGNAYFGMDSKSGRKLESVADLYEWLIDCYASTPKERLLDMFGRDHAEVENLRKMTRDDLALELCERWASAFAHQSERTR